MVMVTHHVEEIPVGFTHALLLREGRVVAAGPIPETITSERIGETFGLPVEITDQRRPLRGAGARSAWRRALW